MGDLPETRYVNASDGAYIAYQVFSEGPVDIAFGFNSDESNVDLMWDEPDWGPFLTGAAEFGRVILHDRRGIGVSSRNVPPPNLETQVADLLAVLDVAGSERPFLFAGTEGGAMHALFAATHPDRTAGLVWNNPAGRTAWAPDYPWGLGPDEFERAIRQYMGWGTTDYGDSIAQWRAAERAGVSLSALDRVPDDANRTNTYAKINRNTASPDVAREILRIDWETDVRAILPSVRAPTALVSGSNDNVEEARYIASLMPNAVLHVLDGRSGLAAESLLQIMRSMAGVELPPAELETILATVMFTDIVGSTERQAALGDRGWKTLVERHHALVRSTLHRWQGVENDTAGDGFYATFDGPARAIRCALEITERVRELGIEVRAGVHTGECELIDGKCGGLSVTTGARISAIAAPSQVLVSQTVKDLTAGSSLTFQDIGRHKLKGIPGQRRLYSVGQ